MDPWVATSKSGLILISLVLSSAVFTGLGIPDAAGCWLAAGHDGLDRHLLRHAEQGPGYGAVTGTGGLCQSASMAVSVWAQYQLHLSLCTSL